MKANRSSARVISYAYPHGDDELIACLKKFFRENTSAFITIDAPIICSNATGTRPVDRLTHTLFHREHAACYPANSTKCSRPIRILRKLEKLGARAGWEINPKGIVVAEVYPHPAMVRMFKLPRIVKYKKGTVLRQRKEFRRLQNLIKTCLKKEFPYLESNTETRELLNMPWSKTVEDKTDAFFCSLIALWHWYYSGKRSEVIGDHISGFILLPEDLRNKPSRPYST